MSIFAFYELCFIARCSKVKSLPKNWLRGQADSMLIVFRDILANCAPESLYIFVCNFLICFVLTKQCLPLFWDKDEGHLQLEEIIIRLVLPVLLDYCFMVWLLLNFIRKIHTVNHISSQIPCETENNSINCKDKIKVLPGFSKF